MTRKARNPGSGKPPSNAPARGAGWGGPAKGFTPNPNATNLCPGVEGKSRGPDGKLLPDEERAKTNARLKQMFVEIADNSDEPTPNRILAADKWLNRDEGMPKQTQALTGADGGPIQQEVTIAHERAATAASIITRRLQPPEDAQG